MVLVYTTCQNIEEAKKIGKTMVEQKIAACINVWPIDSAYVAGEGIKEGAEAALLIKTDERKVQNIEDLVSKIHTYSVPFVGVIDVRRLNREYKEWIATVIQ